MKALALAIFGLAMAAMTTGCCCGGCGGIGHGCGYGANYGGSCCPQPAPACNQCAPGGYSPTYSQPIQGTYITPTNSHASVIPSISTASAVPMESLPTY